ncbi:hypothetical protein GCM10028895_23040 [Pontibacter rugosus]
MTDSTAIEETTISETQTMAGTTDEAATRADRMNNAATDVTDERAYSNMFSTVENTAQYDIVALAKMDPNLTTFVTLLEHAGMSSNLMQGDAYTVFAPTNAAFAALPQDKLSMLMKPESKAELIKLLQVHVLPTEVRSSGFNSSQRIETGGGDHVQIDVGVNDSYITVGGASIVKSDVAASNGVIHVVDSLIQPTETIDRY